MISGGDSKLVILFLHENKPSIFLSTEPSHAKQSFGSCLQMQNSLRALSRFTGHRRGSRPGKESSSQFRMGDQDLVEPPATAI